MNKSDLVDAVAIEAGLTKAQATKAVEALFDAVTTTLKAGDDVRLVGFGTFAVAHRAARTGKNPRSGEVIEIAASKQAKFKPGKALKDALQ